ncbi:MAG: DUF4142 domain-containing protein [Chitinophagaceae bacterium]
MKKASIAFFSAALFFAACNNRDENGSTDTSNTNSSKSGTDSTRGDKPADTTSIANNYAPDKESLDFVTKAASGGMLEMRLGQLAQQKAKSQRVKDFGSMMVTDYSKANDELKSLASSQNITVSSAMLPDHQKHYDMMSKMSGADFDKHYIEMMLDDHKQDINEFRKAANRSGNDVFKSFAGKTLPTLQRHLDSAQAINGMM